MLGTGDYDNFGKYVYAAMVIKGQTSHCRSQNCPQTAPTLEMTQMASTNKSRSHKTHGIGHQLYYMVINQLF